MTETTLAATMFASKTPRQLNHDPEPFVSGVGNRHAENLNPAIWRHDPRPEFDHAQHLQPNLILVEFRRTAYRGKAAHYVTYLTTGDVYDWRHYGDEMKTHAFRVLTRLANAEAAAHAA
ncbi:hypothetical protein [Microbacterium sp. 77mftsu3.1]|uniref:hypothetical protein n=1 Tax=Microbacterium sp. 77mftsu3.1 TaxID=1761802 RepID=UPI000374D525|nr:hypothetical protein [Microbacterium sp. 77mftsu3.1]SDH40659.1 hypothetical protein SAMN04488590_3260 [Microbacterium sp. 77mftsu3.1]